MANLEAGASIRLAARYHGDQAAAPGMLDFAVNVRHGQPPAWLVQLLAARLPDLARYPSGDDVHRAQDAVAERHGRARGEVVPLAGAAEGFALLSNLRPVRAAIIAPSFTEATAALTAAGVPVHHVVLEAPFSLDGVAVPDDADLVVVGNPTNPTSVLHTRAQLLALRRPGRILVVDEAFADAIPGEPESLAGAALPDVLVLRSLTKTWSLAGGHAATDGHRGLLRARGRGRGGSRRRAVGGIACGDGGRSGIGGRRCGRGPGPVRVVRCAGCRATAEAPAQQGNCGAPLRYVRRPGGAVSAGRGAPGVAAAGPHDCRGAGMSVRLRDVIEVLDEAYPPQLAQSWDSVGLVCGDPEDALASVTIAVDATPAVVDEVPG